MLKLISIFIVYILKLKLKSLIFYMNLNISNIKLFSENSWRDCVKPIVLSILDVLFVEKIQYNTSYIAHKITLRSKFYTPMYLHINLQFL